MSNNNAGLVDIDFVDSQGNELHTVTNFLDNTNESKRFQGITLMPFTAVLLISKQLTNDGLGGNNMYVGILVRYIQKPEIIGNFQYNPSNGNLDFIQKLSSISLTAWLPSLRTGTLYIGDCEQPFKYQKIENGGLVETKYCFYDSTSFIIASILPSVTDYFLKGLNSENTFALNFWIPNQLSKLNLNTFATAIFNFANGNNTV